MFIDVSSTSSTLGFPGGDGISANTFEMLISPEEIDLIKALSYI